MRIYLTAMLCAPNSHYGAVAEFRADRDYPVPWFAGDAGRPALSDPAAFGAYAARLLGERAEPGAREGLVPATTLWWADGERFPGRLAIRHRLTPALETMAGQIGYDVTVTHPADGRPTVCSCIGALRTNIRIWRRPGELLASLQQKRTSLEPHLMTAMSGRKMQS
jgi:hypothetical protein